MPCTLITYIAASFPVPGCVGKSSGTVLQGFRTPEEVERFGAMMDEMCYIVATKHSGSLKVPSDTHADARLSSASRLDDYLRMGFVMKGSSSD
jgi:hypothetical protein